MRRWAGPFALALSALALTACGDTYYVPEGELEVVNSVFSFRDVVGVEVAEAVGPNFLAYDVDLDPGDSVVMDVFPSSYDVSVVWEDGGLHTYVDVDVWQGERTVVTAER